MKRILLPAAIAIWITSVAGGMWMLSDYEFTPGTVYAAPADWPADSRLTRSAAQPTLLMFIHPQCPCSKASAEELSRTVARQFGRVSIVAVVYQPGDVDAGWMDSSTMNAVRAIHGVTVFNDVNAFETRRFHAATSGEMLLYSPAGTLLYHGGITGSRSHEGANAAQSALEARVEDPSLPFVSLPSFGCAILSGDMEDGPSGGH